MCVGWLLKAWEFTLHDRRCGLHIGGSVHVSLVAQIGAFADGSKHAIHIAWRSLPIRLLSACEMLQPLLHELLNENA